MTPLSDFAAFKASEPARAMFRKMGLTEYLEAADSWRELRRLIVHFNDPDIGRFVDIARHAYGGASSGERVLLLAIMYVCDFAWLADELIDGHAWRRMHAASGKYRQAVAACIAAEDF
jgi:hypothetical protein